MTRPRSVDEHVAAVLARVAPLPLEDVALVELAVEGPGRVLGADLRAVATVPPFDAAAMDGYAVRLADLPPEGASVTLPVVGDRRPGSRCGYEDGAESGPESGHLRTHSGAVRIMTGAPMPEWADAVVPVERTSTSRFVAGGPTTEREVTLARQPRAHVRHRGEDLRPGDLLARSGADVTPALVAVATSAGHVRIPVHHRPRVAVLSTGSELRTPAPEMPDGAIPDSNSLMLAALVRALGADVVRVGAVPDDADALRTALDLATGDAGDAGDAGDGAAGGKVDLVVTTGGVSAGASDVVRAVLAGADPRLADVDVAAVDVRPGRPQALARWHGVPWVALPGNPVSAFVSFALFARPALLALAGRAPGALERARTVDGWSSPPGRLHVVPVRTLATGQVERATSPAAHDASARQHSGHVTSALLSADALALVSADVAKVEPGDEVDVLPLDGVRRGAAGW